MTKRDKRKGPKPTRKGWWKRFLERMAQANQEAMKKQGCPT